jgi:hypothetical protein
MIYTGVDGKKSFSVNKSLLGKGWSPTQKSWQKNMRGALRPLLCKG